MVKNLQKCCMLIGLTAVLHANTNAQSIDLAIGNISAGFNYNSTTGKITGAYFDVLNNGNDACNDPFEVALYLVKPDDYNVSYKIWSYIDQNGQSGNSAVTYEDIDVDLNTVSPAVPQGCWRLAATVDWNGQITETNENNNSVFISTQGNNLCFTPSSGGVGIVEYNNASLVNVYPNPAFNVVTFSTVKSGNITVTDISGKIIETLVITGEKTSLDMSNYETGIYFYQVKDENNRVISGKLIKQ